MEIVPKQRQKKESYIGSMTSLKRHLGNGPLTISVLTVERWFSGRRTGEAHRPTAITCRVQAGWVTTEGNIVLWHLEQLLEPWRCCSGTEPNPPQKKICCRRFLYVFCWNKGRKKKGRFFFLLLDQCLRIVISQVKFPDAPIHLSRPLQCSLYICVTM